MGFFSKFKSKDTAAKKQPKENGIAPKPAPQKPRWDDAWQRTSIDPEEVQELLRGCTIEIKSRGLDLPFLLLPFRPASDPSAARTFVRNFFGNGLEKDGQLRGEQLMQELRLVEPLVLCSVLKWCWSRLAGGVVTWEAYELFSIGEQDSNSARDSFATFIPISVASDARAKIIFDFFELLSAIAAHGKMNGFSGRKLSRYAGWWAFEHVDTGNGFEGGYKGWTRAADAASHLFFAYLRSLSPESVQGRNGISALPRSLQTLLETTEYPPVPQNGLRTRTSKVVMIVETVSPTPFALLRRAKNFQYREDDRILQRFSDYDDPVDALTEECRRVLKSISSANDLSNSKTSTSLRDPSWSRFEDIGFSGLGEESDGEDVLDGSYLGARKRQQQQQSQGLRTTPASKVDLGGRPTTPSWADFLSSGFVDDPKQGRPNMLLPPDKQLPPINMRGQSSQSHRRINDDDSLLEPAELAKITVFDLDDTFWWVWITSLAGEEPAIRKAAFGRCALIETRITGSAWLVMEEIIKGAAPEPEAGAYVAEKKSRFGFSKRTKLSRSKSSAKGTLAKADSLGRSNIPPPASKISIAPDQHARIQAAAAALQKRNQQEDQPNAPRRARKDEETQTKTTSVLTLQPIIMKEAAPAMKWASSYDKNNIRAKYLGDNFAGRGSATDLLDAGSVTSAKAPSTNGAVLSPVQGSFEPAGFKQNTNHNEGPPVPMKQEPPLSRGEELAQAAMQPLPPTPSIDNRSNPADLPPLPATPSKERNEIGATPLQEVQTATPERQPISSTSDYPRPMERQAAPPTKLSEITSSNPTSQAMPQPDQGLPPQANDGAPLSPPSPESPKQAQNKLKKKNAQSGGFKSIFGRKKVDENGKSSKSPAYTAASSSSAVAAAKAALEAKASQNQASPTSAPQNKVTNRRYSALGNKGPIEETPAAPPTGPPPGPPPGPPMEPSDNATPTLARDDSMAPSRNAPVASPSHASVPQQPQPGPTSFRDIANVGSRSDSLGPKQSHPEGNNAFGQGPLQDVPAFVPDDSSRGSSIPKETHALQDHGSPDPQPVQDPSIGSRAPEGDRSGAQKPQTPARDDVSEISDDAVDTSPATDRWAQIRKNAADRAAKMNEEQAINNSKTEDENDISEETIESRVARIKARVAELTGNMDNHGARA